MLDDSLVDRFLFILRTNVCRDRREKILMSPQVTVVSLRQFCIVGSPYHTKEIFPFRTIFAILILLMCYLDFVFCLKKQDKIQHEEEKCIKEERYQHNNQAYDGYGKPLLLPQELATSPRYSVLPETVWTARPTTVSPKHGKPVLLQQELAKSSFTPDQGYCGLRQREKKQNTEIRKPKISPAGHAKPTMFSQNANQSSNTDPGANFIPRSSLSDSVYHEDVSKTDHIARSVNEMITTCSLQSSSSLTTALHTVQALDYVSGETVRESSKGREIISQSIKSHHAGQRYIISPVQCRSARPVMLPTEVRTELDMRAVPNVGETPKMYQRHLILSDIIVLGSFEKDCLFEEGIKYFLFNYIFST